MVGRGLFPDPWAPSYAARHCSWRVTRVPQPLARGGRRLESVPAASCSCVGEDPPSEADGRSPAGLWSSGRRSRKRSFGNCGRKRGCALVPDRSWGSTPARIGTRAIRRPPWSFSCTAAADFPGAEMMRPTLNGYRSALSSPWHSITTRSFAMRCGSSGPARGGSRGAGVKPRRIRWPGRGGPGTPRGGTRGPRARVVAS